MDIVSLKRMLESEQYVFDKEFLVTLFVALELGKPLLIEGGAGVGKTEVAKVLAAVLDTELVRLQCYEGLDEAKSLYEWNYQKQLINIQLKITASEQSADLFSEEYLLERPLLKAIRSEKQVVLLIDEIDKTDEEFEAFLLELLSDFQVSIPEIGTIRAKTHPVVILTSNSTRELSDALKRRCAYIYIEYPDIDKEAAIIRARIPEAGEKLIKSVTRVAAWLRAENHVYRKPSVAETLDWVMALMSLGKPAVDRLALEQTSSFLLKNREDKETVLAHPELDAVLNTTTAAATMTAVSER